MSWSNGTADPGAQYQQRPPHNSFFDTARSSGWYCTQNRTTADVCPGITARQGWDLSLVHVLTVVATLYMPVAAIAYDLAWLLLPEAADGRIYAGEILKGRSDVTVIGGVLMALAGLSSALSSIGIINGVGLGWFQLLVLAAAMIVITVVTTSIARSAFQGGPHRYGAVPPYGTSQHGAPQYGNPRYGTCRQQVSVAGASVPFGHSASGAKDTGSTMPQQQNVQAPESFLAYGVPAGSAASAGTLHPDGVTSAAQGMNAGLRPAVAHPTQPYAG